MTKTFANEGNQDIWRAQTQAKTAKVSAPKWKNHNFRKFLIYQCIFWITIEICKESRGSKKILWFLSKKQKQKKKQCMHCFLQYGQGCMWRFSVIHLLRPHGSAYGGWKKLACFASFNDYLKNKISD